MPRKSRYVLALLISVSVLFIAVVGMLIFGPDISEGAIRRAITAHRMRGFDDKISMYKELNPDFNLDPNNSLTIYAASCDNTPALKMLHENGFSINQIDELGHSAIEYAAMNRNDEMIDFILSKTGIDGFPSGHLSKVGNEYGINLYERYRRIETGLIVQP